LVQTVTEPSKIIAPRVVAHTLNALLSPGSLCGRNFRMLDPAGGCALPHVVRAAYDSAFVLAVRDAVLVTTRFVPDRSRGGR
jgi:hypothetical protein